MSTFITSYERDTSARLNRYNYKRSWQRFTILVCLYEFLRYNYKQACAARDWDGASDKTAIWAHFALISHSHRAPIAIRVQYEQYRSAQCNRSAIVPQYEHDMNALTPITRSGVQWERIRSTFIHSCIIQLYMSPVWMEIVLVCTRQDTDSDK